MNKSRDIYIVCAILSTLFATSTSFITPNQNLAVPFSRELAIELLDEGSDQVTDIKPSAFNVYELHNVTRNYSEKINTSKSFDEGSDQVIDLRSPKFNVYEFHNVTSDYLENVNASTEQEQNFGNFEPEMDALEWFFHRLRGFVSDYFFDWRSFEQSKQTMRKEFVKLRDWIGSSNLRDENIQTRLKFAERMLIDMEVSVEIIMYFNLNTIQTKLLRNMIRLSVGTYMFFDAYGNPDTLKPSDLAKVIALEDSVRYWEKVHSAVSNFPSTASAQFYVVYDEVRATLRLLAACFFRDQGSPEKSH